jgi:hypothetical protein
MVGIWLTMLLEKLELRNSHSTGWSRTAPRERRERLNPPEDNQLPLTDAGDELVEY